MNTIKTSWFPFGDFKAINLFGVIFYKGSELSQKTLNHEAIHTAQMKEMLYIFFYLWYFIEWITRLCIDYKTAYRSISFEQEAYDNDDNLTYFTTRVKYAWWGKLKK